MVGTLAKERHLYMKCLSQSMRRGPAQESCSGWMLSGPGAFPDLSEPRPRFISAGVKAVVRPRSADGVLLTSFSLLLTAREKSLSGEVYLPLLMRMRAISSGVTGQVFFLEVLPVSLLIVCHAFRLECVKSMLSTTSLQLALRVASRCDFSSAAASVAASAFDEF